MIIFLLFIFKLSFKITQLHTKLYSLENNHNVESYIYSYYVNILILLIKKIV